MPELLLICSIESMGSPSKSKPYISPPILHGKATPPMLNPQASAFSVGDGALSNPSRSSNRSSGVATKKKSSGNVRVLADREVAAEDKVMNLPQSSEGSRADKPTLLRLFVRCSRHTVSLEAIGGLE